MQKQASSRLGGRSWGEGVRAKLTFANVTATIALFVALGGVGYAAGVINGSEIRERSIPADRIGRNVLTGTEIRESSLATVRRATSAASATRATTATSAARADTAASADRAGDANTLDGIDSTGFFRGSLITGRGEIRPGVAPATIADFPGMGRLQFAVTTAGTGDCLVQGPVPTTSLTYVNTTTSPQEVYDEVTATAVPVNSFTSLGGNGQRVGMGAGKGPDGAIRMIVRNAAGKTLTLFAHWHVDLLGSCKAVAEGVVTS
jgi:hypothetical protein